MDLKLTGKTAIVTGGASGIGRAVARMMIAEGARVAVGDLQEEKGQEVVAELQRNGGQALFSRMNTAAREDVRKLVHDTTAAFGQVDILFNVAGPGGVGNQLETDDQEFDRQINGHLRGVLHCTQAVLPQMMERRSGKIVNIASFAGHGCLDSIPAYCAAFGGVIAYTKNVGRFAAPYNININSVSPGNLLTPMTINWLSEGNNMETVTRSIPLGRLGTAEDIAAICVFLSSDLARHITAADINASGGQWI